MGTYHLDLDSKNLRFVFYCLVVFLNILILYFIYLSNLVITTYYYKYRFNQLAQEIKVVSVDSVLNNHSYRRLFSEKEGVIKSLAAIESLIYQANPDLALKNIEELPPPIKPIFARLKHAIVQDREKILVKDPITESNLKQLVDIVLLNYSKPIFRPEYQNAYKKFCSFKLVECI